jgi:hypothetical protein
MWLSHIERLTFWVLVICLLEVLDDTFLADKLFNLALSLDVEGVLVEKRDLVLTLTLGVLSWLLPHGECLPPAGGVVHKLEELRVTLSQLGLGLGVSENLLSYGLRIGLANRSRSRVATRLLRLLPVLADYDSEHLAIPYANIFQCLCLLCDGLAVEVDALWRRRETRLSLDETLEIFDGTARR